MQLNPLQQKILSIIEPLPLRNALVKSTLIETSQIGLGETVTKMLRLLRRRQPMNWDPWILKDGDIYRLYYLRGLEGQNPWWTVSKLCGAISTDLQHWQDLGTLLAPEPTNYWESGRISAGCTYKENDIYYLFYSAGGSEGIHLKNEVIGLATSHDGVHFSRQNYFLKPEDNAPWYGRSNWTNHFHWRDPYIFKDDKTGKYYIFICASLRSPGNFQGSIGLAVADKIDGEYKILPPAIKIPTDTENWAYYHMERPQVIYKNGKYNLFFSCFKMLMNPKWTGQKNNRKITNSSLYWYICDNIEGNYQPVNQDNFIVRGSEKTGMYRTNFLQLSTQSEQFIAYGWYHRWHTLGVSPLLGVNWDNDNNSSISIGDFAL